MRGLTSLYSLACEMEGTTSNSHLLQVFRKMDMVEEQVSPGDLQSDEEADERRARSRAVLREAFPTSLVVGSPANYLGDAGTAAVIRMLPHLRWIRRLEARGTGAGPRAVAALCEVLNTSETVAVNVDPQHSEDEDGAEPAQTLRESTVVRLTLPVVPLEWVDLRDNAVFALSASDLLRAVKQRCATVAAARAALASVAKVVRPRVDLPTPPTILLDFDAVPPTVVSALKAFGHDADAAARKKAAAAQRKLQVLKASLFCVAGGEGDGGSHQHQQATGEQVVYRIPEYFPTPPLRQSAAEPSPVMPLYDTANASAVATVGEVNKHMERYLFAYRCLAARNALVREERKREQSSTPHGCGEAALGARPSPHAAGGAAAQLCIDLGADVLPSRQDTLAVVWLALDMERLRRLTEEGGEGKAMGEEEVGQGSAATAREREEVLYGVSRFLRGLLASGTLEDELLASASETPVLRRHLERMKELYYALTSGAADDVVAPTGSGQPTLSRPKDVPREEDNADVYELRGVYLRVVSAMVTEPFSEQRIPTMAAAEKRIAEIRKYLVEYLLEGKAAPSYAPAPAPANVRAPLLEAKRALAFLCAAAKYFRANHKEECAEWNARLLGRHPNGKVAVADRAAAAPPPEQDVVAFYLSPLSACTCARDMAVSPIVSEDAGESRRPVNEVGAVATAHPRPCPACCHAALGELYHLLNDDYSMQREALLAPLRLYLPHEVKCFLLDLVLERQQHGQAHQAWQWQGSGYTPSLFGLPSSLEAFTAHQDHLQDPKRCSAGAGAPSPDPHPVTVVDLFAHMDGRRERLVEFCDAFAEWYRLRAVESLDGTRPDNSHPTPPLSFA